MLSLVNSPTLAFKSNDHSSFGEDEQVWKEGTEKENQSESQSVSVFAASCVEGE